MQESTGIEQKEQVNSQPTTSTVSTPVAASNETTPLKTLIAACSVAIIGCFFLPWIQFLFGTPSGYDLQQLPSDQVKLLWFIPGAAILPLLALAAKEGVSATAAIAGATPFLAIIYYLSQFGSDLLNSLQVGAYLTLLLGAALCILAGLLSKTKS